MDSLLVAGLLGALAVLVFALTAVAVYLVWKRAGRGSRSGHVDIHASIQQMRSIGQLSVFKVITKEIVTETDHSWGDFGARYLRWVLSSRKMAMIFHFEIDFRYDLRRPDFEIIGTSKDSFIIKMPPCFYEVRIRDIRFYDEQKSRFMPWLLPDLLNAFFGAGFSEEDKNRLVDAARGHAEKQAVELIGSLQSEVQNSAKATLASISRAFGAQNVAFEFLAQEGPITLSIKVPAEQAA